MEYIGEAMEDMIIQRAYENLRKRGYTLAISNCYYRLLGILQREGEKALNNYVETVSIRKD